MRIQICHRGLTQKRLDVETKGTFLCFITLYSNLLPNLQDGSESRYKE